MKKLAIIGKSLKFLLLSLIAYGAVKLVATYIYGYKKVDPTYGGPFYYYWSARYIDERLPKTPYEPNKLSEQRKNGSFKRYVEAVQTAGDKKGSVYPYYAYGLPDTFVLSPKNTWSLFDTREKMDLEFKFLELRGRFISMMHGIKYDANGPYFKNAAVSDGSKKPASTVGKPLCKRRYFRRLEGSEVRTFFSEAANKTLVDVAEFEAVVRKVMSGKKGYGVEYPEGVARMTPEFEADVMRIVDRVFAGFGIDASMVNGFFQRVSVLNPTPMDVHILNRIKLYFVYANSYLDADKTDNAAYHAYKKIYDELNERVRNGEQLDDTKERKLKNVDMRMHAIRMTMVCNKASMLMASVLGPHGPVLRDDRRGYFERFGNPKAATEKNMKGKTDTTLFDDQMRSHLGQ